MKNKLTPEDIEKITGQKPVRVLDSDTNIINLYFEGRTCQSYTKVSLIKMLLSIQRI